MARPIRTILCLFLLRAWRGGYLPYTVAENIGLLHICERRIDAVSRSGHYAAMQKGIEQNADR
jgi:hypothetical protein